MKPGIRLGMFAHPGTIAIPLGGPIFGMHSACRSGAQAILRHSEAESVHFVCSPQATPYTRREIEIATAERTKGPRCSLEPLLDFTGRKDGEPLTAWLDLGGDTTRPFAFRRRIGANYPIAVVHHSVSYGYVLHNWFLPLLLGDVRPQDTLVCTSPSALRVMARTLDQMARDLGEQHGIPSLAYKGRLDVVPLGVDCDRFRPREKAAAREKIPWIGKDEIALLWVGRISAHDKADLIPLLRVFRKLVEVHPGKKLRLVIAGSPRTGSDELSVLAKEAVRLEIRDKVSEISPCQNELLPDLYAASDIFVSPADSVQEMFGLTVVEAMASGLSVVCSDWGGYRDSVVHGETGFLVRTYGSLGDEDAVDLGEWSLLGGELLDQLVLAQSVAVCPRGLFQALSTLVEKPDLRREMGRAGRLRAERKFAWPKVVSEYDALFRELSAMDLGKPLPGHPYSRPRFDEVFAEYPSRVFADALLEPSDGERGKKPRDPRPETGTIDGGTLAAVSEMVERRGRASLLEIETAFAPAPAHRIRRHVLWLMKYGHIQVEENA